MSVHLKENLFREIMEIFKILSRQVTQHNHFFVFLLYCIRWPLFRYIHHNFSPN